MQSINLIIPALVLSVSFAVGCDPEVADIESDDASGEVSLRPGTGSQGGVWLNTSAIGNHAFSELDLKKAKHDGVRLNRVLIKRPNNVWIVADKVWSQDGEIRALVGASSYTGNQLVGSKWELTLVSGLTETPAVMWIGSALNGANSWRYSFEHDDGYGGVAKLCNPDAQGNTTAVPIADLTVNTTTGDMDTRSNTLYLACVSGALGKAVNWGYRPWQLGVDDFAAMVRVVRADYCGNGVSWTSPGTSMQMKDVWNISTFGNTSAANEALWDDGGALCIGTARSAGTTAVACNGVALPSCAANISLASNPSALVWTKLAQ